MTAEELIRGADRAWRDGQMDLWRTHMWLLKTLYGMDYGAGRRLHSNTWMRERYGLDHNDECQKDHDEYVEEMSLGGRRYDPNRR